jgi:hypothetical protein
MTPNRMSSVFYLHLAGNGINQGGEILADVRIAIQGKEFFHFIQDEVPEKEPFCFKNGSQAKTA